MTSDALMYVRIALWAVRPRASAFEKCLACVVFVSTVPSCKIKMFKLEPLVDHGPNIFSNNTVVKETLF